MARVQPDLEWYSAISRAKGVVSRCPFATVKRCPRYYQSLFLLGSTGFSTPIPTAENEQLRQYWQGREGWPVTDEQMTSVSGPEGHHDYYNFCPEAAFDAFGLFCTFLSRYADEADMYVAHQQLSRTSSQPGHDWGWAWSNVSPLHYTDCSLYSIVSTVPQKSQDSPSAAQEKNGEIVEVKPGAFGVTLNVKRVISRFAKWWLRRYG
jgi:hypothetical protein